MITPERASLVLFKAYPLWDVETVKEKAFYSNDMLIKYGLVFNKALSPVDGKVLENVLAIYPRDRFHATFWSFNDTIKHEEEGIRILHQLIHYFSTYGLESLGLPSAPYIPNEDYKDTFEGFIKERLVIDALGIKELKTKVVNLLNIEIPAIPKTIWFFYWRSNTNEVLLVGYKIFQEPCNITDRISKPFVYIAENSKVYLYT